MCNRKFIIVNVAEKAMQLVIDCRERGRESCATGIECRKRERDNCATGNLLHGTWQGKLCNSEFCVGDMAVIAVQLGIECRELGRESCASRYLV